MEANPLNSNPEKVVRKLTTILASDVVGYSKMMSADEEGTLRTLRAYRTIIDGLIEKHGGREFNRDFPCGTLQPS